MGAQYKEYRFDELRLVLAGVPGVPEAALVAITGIAFATLPIPQERRDAIAGRLSALEQERAWAHARGASADVLAAMDEWTTRLRNALRPKVPLTTALEGEPTRLFISFAKLGDSSKRTIELGAFVIMAMKVLQANGLVLKHTEEDEIKAAREDRELPPTAPEVVSRILDRLAWESNRPGQHDPKEARDGSRTPESVLKMYDRYTREFRPGTLSVNAYGENVNARLLSAEEIERFVRLAYPGAHGTPQEQWMGGWSVARVWLPVEGPA
jgi:hypothetical protein